MRRPYTCRTGKLVFPNLVKESLFTLLEVFLNGEFFLGVIRRQVLQFLDELVCDIAICISELIWEG